MEFNIWFSEGISFAELRSNIGVKLLLNIFNQSRAGSIITINLDFFKVFNLFLNRLTVVSCCIRWEEPDVDSQPTRKRYAYSVFLDTIVTIQTTESFYLLIYFKVLNSTYMCKRNVIYTRCLVRKLKQTKPYDSPSCVCFTIYQSY